MSPGLRRVLRSVQPFYGLEYLRSLGKADGLRSYEDDSPYHDLSTINRMSNIDKHRRLAVTALWWSDIVSWGSDGPTQRRWLPGDGTFVDGAIVGYMVGSDGQADDVNVEFNLIVADPLSPSMWGAGDQVVATAKRWHRMVEWTLGQVISGYAHIKSSAESYPE